MNFDYERCHIFVNSSMLTSDSLHGTWMTLSDGI